MNRAPEAPASSSGGVSGHMGAAGEAATNLSMLKPGQKGRVVSIKATGVLKRRLIDMGVLAGETLMVEKIAPFGDPMNVSVRGFVLSIRKKEAEGVGVELLK